MLVREGQKILDFFASSENNIEEDNPEAMQCENPEPMEVERENISHNDIPAP
jgi:hypothetical protein